MPWRILSQHSCWLCTQRGGQRQAATKVDNPVRLCKPNNCFPNTNSSLALVSLAYQLQAAVLAWHQQNTAVDPPCTEGGTMNAACL
jgi:hypothetical protein